jgi:uncharacterized phage protein gp47/JayE
MPFSFPTLPALRQQIRDAFTARLPGADARVRRNAIQVTSDVVSGVTWAQYAYLGYLAKQLFTDTAETSYLERQGREYGINREGATAATGNAIFSGTIGYLVPAGTEVESLDATVQYLTSAAGTVASTGEISIPVVATTLGTVGNADPGTPLTLQTAIAGILPDVVVDSSGLSGALDQESDDALRGRILTRKRQPPQGGAAADYIAWAKACAGVTRAWCYPLARGAGTVDVYFVMDNRTNIIPQAADIAVVQAYLATEAPVTADVRVAAPTPVAYPVTVAGLQPKTAVVEAAISAGLEAVFATATPGSAVIGDGVSTAVPGGTIFLEAISAAINESAGVIGFDLAAPITDIATGYAQIATLGAVTFP